MCERVCAFNTNFCKMGPTSSIFRPKSRPAFLINLCFMRCPVLHVCAAFRFATPFLETNYMVLMKDNLCSGERVQQQRANYHHERAMDAFSAFCARLFPKY